MLLYILLGIVQGFTEALPISSSGHIFLLNSILNNRLILDLNLEIFLNFASFLAIFIIYRKDICYLISSFFKYLFGNKLYKNEFKYVLLIIIGTLPAGILGVLFKSNIENIMYLHKYILGVGFIISAILLYFVSDISGSKGDYEITVKDALVIGLFQSLALFPGISRSGMTLIGALFCKINKDASLKYSFMLYFPVSLATIILEIGSVLNGKIYPVLFNYYCIGMVFAFVFTYISFLWLVNIVRCNKLWFFSIYLFLVGLITVIYFI